VNLGTIPESWREPVVPDVTSVELVAWAPLLAGILVLGLFPGILFGTTRHAVEALVKVFGG
jgi:NADH:ubiquinone oxidoreductase subunit 4 (subunit M)